MMRLRIGSGRVLGVLALVACLAGGARVAAGQVVRGEVREISSRIPIVNAAVVVRDSAREIVGYSRTDERGGFTLRLPVSKYSLRVVRVGFAPESVSTPALDALDTTNVLLEMRPVALTLSPALIKAERRRIVDMRALGLNLKAIGTHPITPSEIEVWSRGAHTYVDAIRNGLPPDVLIGASMNRDGTPGAPCVGKVQHGYGSNACAMVIVDGVRIDDPDSVIDLVQPEWLDHAIFIRPADGAGMRFGTGADGGVLLLFTKFGGYALDRP